MKNSTRQLPLDQPTSTAVEPVFSQISDQEAKPKAPLRKKYEMCKNFREKGTCKYGDKCLFAHGEHELYKIETPAPVEQTASKVEEMPIVATPVKAKSNASGQKDLTEPTINKLLEDLDS